MLGNKFGKCEMAMVFLYWTACCAEAKNLAACRVLCISNIFYSSGCYINIPHSALASQMLSSLSHCIAHSGKKWCVECPTLQAGGIECLRKFASNEISKGLTLSTN